VWPNSGRKNVDRAPAYPRILDKKAGIRLGFSKINPTGPPLWYGSGIVDN
jgi:hypothetical protein